MSKILVIDDEESIRLLLKLSLTHKGYEVILAEDGEKGIEAFKQTRPPIVLTDIKMPGMDGIQVLKQIKQLDPDTRIIVITGHGEMESAIEALQLEASDFINKPVSDEALSVALKRAEEVLWLKQKLRKYTSSLELMVKEATEELIESERVSAIGQAVAGMAHYMKNILNGLQGGRYIVNTGFKKDKPDLLAKGWAMVENNIGKISDLALNMLAYSKEREPDYVSCNPNDIAQEVYDLMYETLEARSSISYDRMKKKGMESRVKLVKDFDSSISECYLDPSGLHRCLLNLVTNAIDACTLEADAGKDWSVVIRTREEGDGVRFDIVDNGMGMTKEVQDKVFDRFFSTKAGQGTGLGLLVTQKIVDEHGGTISFESEPGKGTTFTMRFPRGRSERLQDKTIGTDIGAGL
jgi:signal transduction histidine kinase